MRYLFFDIECANCDGGNGKICSFGYVLTDETLEPIVAQDILINPRAPFHLTGRDNRPLLELAYPTEAFLRSPDFPKVYEELRALLEAPDQTVLGFALENDAAFLRSECERYHLPCFSFCFVDVQKLLMQQRKLPNTPSLENAMEMLQLTQTEISHRSDEDAQMTRRVLKALLLAAGLPFSALCEQAPLSYGKLENGVVTTAYLEYRAAVREEKERAYLAMHPDRVDWLVPQLQNYRVFRKFVKKVRPVAGSAPVFRMERICFDRKYEESHFTAMVHLVQLLTNAGGRYTNKLSEATLLVAAPLAEGQAPGTEFLPVKAIEAEKERGHQIRTVSFADFLDKLGITTQTLAALPPQTAER